MEEDDFLPDPMALKGYISFTLKPFGSIAFPDSNIPWNCLVIVKTKRKWDRRREEIAKLRGN